MTATNHDDQLGEIYPMMLNELNCTFGVRFSRFHCCGRHGPGRDGAGGGGHGITPSWPIEANSWVRGRVQNVHAAQKAPEGDDRNTHTHTHTILPLYDDNVIVISVNKYRIAECCRETV